jgi:hypothetical protein
MKPALYLLAALALSPLAGCVAPTGPVEVTRSNDPALLQRVGRTTVAIETAPGGQADSLEMRTYQAAVARELVKLGFSEAAAGSGALVAQVRLDKTIAQPPRRSPVSVGVGGGTGGYGSGVGVGIGLDLSGPPPEELTTQMQVMLRERATNAVAWEGRASFTVRASSPLAQAPLGAAKMAEALFAGFPGNSGETIEVK